jgi:hypothetical protein
MRGSGGSPLCYEPLRAHGGPAEEARLDRPHRAVVGPDGAVYIGDPNNHRIRKVARE